VFSAVREQERLATQNRLMFECESPLFRSVFAERSGLTVLDVGSNNGEKTVRWFSHPAVSRVLGLEYNESMALLAHEKHGGERFSFCPCDVEAEDFGERLSSMMVREGIEAFDVIYLSFVLSHLSAPEALLRRLRPLLRPGGRLIAVETDDSRATLSPDDAGLLRAFLDLLAEDPYAGDRGTGSRLQAMLAESGFAAPEIHCDALAAGPGEEAKKAMIFEMFFTFLPEDLAVLRAEAPEDERCKRWQDWLSAHYEELRSAICAPCARISMGISVVSCCN
jgi:SAM-dependent methyltransferase